VYGRVLKEARPYWPHLNKSSPTCSRKFAPWDQLRDVCRFLDVEFSAAMLDYWDSPPAKAVARLTHHRNLLMPVFTSSIGRYREVLTSAEIATIHRRLYSPMQLLGYLSYQEYDEISCQEARRAEVARDNEAAL
jgi:hypothetical protein